MIIYESDIRAALHKNTAVKKEQKPEHTRAAVLIPVIVKDNAIEMLLTRRTDQVEHHKNQISFPGGAVDPEDKTIVETALRETEEELGIAPEKIEVIGSIDEVTTPSGFLITPVVGLLKQLPSLRLHRIEVEDAFTVPLDFFTGQNNVRVEHREYEGKKHDVYFYRYEDKEIWGVTAYIIRLFIRCIAGTKKNKF